MRPKIIAVGGNFGCGKDYIVSKLLIPMIVNGRPYAILSFADHFKLESIVKDKLDRNKVYGRKDHHTRDRLQKKGTEEGRMVYGPDIWVNILSEQIHQFSERGTEFVFITDCRFDNEIDFVHREGGIVLGISAPDRHQLAVEQENKGILASDSANTSDTTVHPSEQSLPLGKLDYIIDNTVANQPFVADRIREIVLSLRKRSFLQDENVIFCDLDDTLVNCYPVYQKVRERIKKELSLLGLDPEEFDEQYQESADEQYSGPLSRETFAKHIEEILLFRLTNFPKEKAPYFYDLAMSVHQEDFPVPNKDILPAFEALSSMGRVVIVTLGDPVDQIRKIYKAGLKGHSNVECVVQKTTQTYVSLMKKYPSRNYIMIGDSETRDIKPAQEAGIPQTVLTDATNFALVMKNLFGISI